MSNLDGFVEGDVVHVEKEKDSLDDLVRACLGVGMCVYMLIDMGLTHGSGVCIRTCIHIFMHMHMDMFIDCCVIWLRHARQHG